MWTYHDKYSYSLKESLRYDTVLFNGVTVHGFLKSFVDDRVLKLILDDNIYSSKYLSNFSENKQIKQVNDNFGHRMGDEVLIKIGKTFQKSIEGMSARVSRYGGDEFVFVFENTKTRKEIEKYIYALQKQFLDAFP